MKLTYKRINEFGHIHHTTVSWYPFVTAIADFINGLRYGYPLCCVLNYSLEGLFPFNLIFRAIRNGYKVKGKNSYFVSCWYHHYCGFRNKRLINTDKQEETLKYVTNPRIVKIRL